MGTYYGGNSFLKMRRLLIIGVVGIILNCTRASDSTVANSDKVDTVISGGNIALDSFDFNIIEYDASYRYIFPETFQTTDLTRKEIEQCEALLKLFIAEYNVEATNKFDEMSKKYPKMRFKKEDFTIDLNEYGRQYMGAISEHQKFVYVNCFCEPNKFDTPDKQLVQVDDGGNCFFNFKVDLKNRKIFDFIENGVA
jgi:hypothetical protein